MARPCSRWSSAPLDGVEVGDGDDGADDGDEYDPAGDDAEEEVLERRRDPRLRGLRDLRQHQRRRDGRRGRPILGRALRGRRRPDDGHPAAGRPAAGRDAERRRAAAAAGAEGLPEPPGHGQRRRDGGGGHGILPGLGAPLSWLCGSLGWSGVYV
ncbi:hypothetical protein PVAP13_9NG587128 [Panicum virgatum]|uniref:Uncharacterized protein n=1 Tax=Panicum virgatum TaxID=38727 RepID=A0A8T0MUL4_PANVG|nr:hypothetical protein PVAP13_9NG587128 [Panicum virgatum]